MLYEFATSVLVTHLKKENKDDMYMHTHRKNLIQLSLKKHDLEYNQLINLRWNCVLLLGDCWGYIFMEGVVIITNDFLLSWL